MNEKETSILDATIEILRKTSDGDDLSPLHLSLLQHAANSGLSEQGEIAFYELLANVRSGYTPPWFHGIEHLTIDYRGYVFWKGQEVEHYELRWAYSKEAKASAAGLAERCRHLEAKGVPVNTVNAVWKWDDFKGEDEQ